MVSAFGFLDQLYVALGVTVLVAVLAITSAEIAVKAQYFIMAAIALSLVSLALGAPLSDTQVEMWGVPQGEPFWQVFAVFFPAVTGIMAGVNMSGDLKNPSQSIPTGTLAAVGTGYAIYMILPVFLASRADAATLVSDPLVMQRIAAWGPAILLGVWGATLSSAIGSILGAPRVLQALARDGVLPSWLSFLGKGSGANDEPRMGTAVTLGIVIAAVCVGDLNLIAPVLTMFFLTTYLVLNVSAGLEGFLNSPSFRPLFKVHWSLSALGALGCLGVMFLINPIATLLAGAIVASIFFWLQRQELQSAWGDVRRGIWMLLLRTSLFQLGNSPDAKNWRPNFLVLSGSPMQRWGLIEFANALSHNRGLFTVTSILPTGSRGVAQQKDMEATISNYLLKRGVQALVRVLTAPDPYEGAERLVEIYGLGQVMPDTVLMGNSKDLESRDRYCNLITRLHQAERNVVIFREAEAESPRPRRSYRQIDVWWGGLNLNGSLMLILADLLRADIDWREAKLYLKLVVPDETAADQARHNLDRLTDDLRIRAELSVLVANGRPFEAILQEASSSADRVFIGMALPDDDFPGYYERLQARVAGLPSTVFVLAAPEFRFTNVLAED
ncbi:amino acid permease [Nodosilinea sp. LEGE 07088]|uniref:amino acid permease n=1 Tax=Nodosilinea sp. LEGE 07088 TaxID=2777968 RepID=UPI001882F548|nr:amino acid permease [Nodosilinea sp. LEGE 07088]MBE9139852.1 amino acid permease [Nodosilinea sp. LEGE 07088]